MPSAMLRFSSLRTGLLAVFLLLVAAVSAQAQRPVANETLTAADILQAVREAQGSRHENINGVLRDDITDLRERLDESERAAQELPHRSKYLLLVNGFLGRLLELHLELVDEVERELDG